MANVYFLSYDLLVKQDAPVPGAVELIRRLVKKTERFMILCESTLYARRRMAERMYEIGFPLLSDDLFYTSLNAAMDIIAHRYPGQKSAVLIGTRSLKDELENNGFSVNNGEADWVFVGMDRNAAYAQYNAALQVLLTGARIITLSAESLTATGEIGSGAVAAMLEAASNQKRLSTGWDSRLMIQCAMRHFDLEEEEVLFVSDRLEPEIASAVKAGVRTVYVLPSPDTDLSEIVIRPTYVVESLGSISR